MTSATILPLSSLYELAWKVTLIWELCCTQNPTIRYSWAPSLLVAKRNYAGHLAQGISADGDLIMFLAALLVLKGCAALLAVWSLAYSTLRLEVNL